MRQDPPRWLERVIPVLLVALAVLAGAMVLVALYVILSTVGV